MSGVSTPLADPFDESALVTMTTALDRSRTSEIAFGPSVFAFDHAGVLWFEQDRVLIVSDLHLEKGSSFARRGMMLPPYDTRETLSRLAQVLARYQPATVVALGDTWHDPQAMSRMGSDEAEAFAAMRKGIDWVWITGNHDPVVPSVLGGHVAESVTFGGVMFRHEPSLTPPGFEVAGHLHPAGKIRMRGRAVRRRCFISDGIRCVMPAFGSYAGGLNILDTAFSRLFSAPFAAHFLGAERLYRIAPGLLCHD